MKVDLAVAPVTAGLFRTKIRHRLTIKVQFTPEERKALKIANIDMRELFTHPPFSDGQAARNERLHGSNWSSYLVCHLFNTPYVDFSDVVQANTAKEELVVNLHGLKQTIDAAQQGPTSESFEL